MSHTRLVVPAGIGLHDPADDHLELVWWNTPGSAPARVGRLLAELLAVALGAQGDSGCQPEGVDLRWRSGAVLASFAYGGDAARARWHTGVLQRELATQTVARFVAAVARDLDEASPPGLRGTPNSRATVLSPS
ncbi:hypothetical protein ACIP10_35945 [Streptomyces galbus]|uniref:hypothetical protein n=1 Tax=Streptomyces galbus TaxID=33898 RepID=UPI003812C8F9